MKPNILPASHARRDFNFFRVALRMFLLSTFVLLTHGIPTSSALADGMSNNPHRARSCNYDSGCCQRFSFFSDGPRTKLEVDFTGELGADTSCFDLTCLFANTGLQYSVGVSVSSPSHFKIIFTPSWTDTLLPPYFEFTLCPKQSSTLGCESLWDHYSWKTYHGAAAQDSGGAGMSWCYSGFNCGSGCDVVTMFQLNNAKEFCVHRTSLTSATQIKVTFVPPLTNCGGIFSWDGMERSKRYLPGDTVPLIYDTCAHFGGGIIGGYDSCWTIHSWYITDTLIPPHQKWKQDSNITVGDTQTMYFTLQPGHTFGCDTWCMIVPECNPLTSHDVRIQTLPPDTNPTTPCGDGWLKKVSFKPAFGQTEKAGSSDRAGNYPNPFGSSSGFKTTIPFLTSAEGDASIRITDANGREILKETVHVFGRGRHFFYFSGEQLPTGTYYYSIEFPRGKVIERRSMLLVH